MKLHVGELKGDGFNCWPGRGGEGRGGTKGREKIEERELWEGSGGSNTKQEEHEWYVGMKKE